MASCTSFLASVDPQFLLELRCSGHIESIIFCSHIGSIISSGHSGVRSRSIVDELTRRSAVVSLVQRGSQFG